MITTEATYSEYRQGLGQYTLRGLELLAQDEGLSETHRQAVADEARDRLTEAFNTASE
jgi:hypothetical protein